MTATTIHASLLAFHKDAEKLDLKKTAAGVHSNYLPLDAAMEQIRPLLAEHGLYVRHITGFAKDNGWRVATIVVHAESGDEVSSGWFPLLPSKQDAQGFGGALTYGRRYTLMEVLALVADEDDDGAGGNKARARTPRAAGMVTAAQRRELMEEARVNGVSTDQVKAIIKEVAGVDTSEQLPSAKFADVKKAIKAAKS